MRTFPIELMRWLTGNVLINLNYDTLLHVCSFSFICLNDLCPDDGPAFRCVLLWIRSLAAACVAHALGTVHILLSLILELILACFFGVCGSQLEGRWMESVLCNVWWRHSGTPCGVYVSRCVWKADSRRLFVWGLYSQTCQPASLQHAALCTVQRVLMEPGKKLTLF